jgi:hypothetical protein
MPAVHQLPCGGSRVAAGGDIAILRPCAKGADFPAPGLKSFMLISDFIAGRGWRSPDRRYPHSGDISNQAEGLQEPDQDHHEHDYVEQTFDRTGHRDIGID